MDNITAGIAFESLYNADMGIDASEVNLHLRGADVYNVALQKNNDGWALNIPSSLSHNWVSGKYFYIITATKEGDISQIEQGHIEIKSNPLLMEAGSDFRSYDEIALENVNAVLMNKATFAQKEYRIGNRHLERFSPAELLDIKSRLEKRVQAQKNAEKRRSTGEGRLIIQSIPIRLGVC